jgi:hypothetical protein
MERRGGKSELLGKLDKRHIATFLAEKRSELFFQSVTHPAMLSNNLFRLRNKLLDSRMETGIVYIMKAAAGKFLVVGLWLLLPAVAQAQFTFTTNNGAITITAYTGSGGMVGVPSTTNGFPVTIIGNSAFLNKSAVTRLIIPNSVTNIGNSAFLGCSGLTNITIGSSVTNIGNAAFQSCTKLTSVLIPDGVANLGSNVFYSCSALTNVFIGSGVTNIGIAAFQLCTKLPNVTIPNKVANLGDNAFNSCLSLTNVTIPNGVTNIGASAFAGCINLASISIPDTVIKIGQQAFQSCKALTAIPVDPNNSAYSSLSGVLFNFNQTTLLQYPGGIGGSYTIPSNVTNIEAYAFYACNNLTDVALGSGVTSIGTNAFNNCKSLTSVKIPNSVTIICDGAFYFCSSLTNFTLSTNLTCIGPTAFQYCPNLTSIIIPDSVTNIGQNAFFSCGLSNIILGSSVVIIGDFAFSQCPVSSVIIPSGVARLGDSFENCAKLLNITIPKSVTNIMDWALSGCTSLTGIFFAGNTPILGSHVFDGDSSTISIYYLPGAVGWSTNYGGLRTVLWNPHAQTGDGNFGVQTNQFGFNITGSSNLVIVVEASTNLVNPTWVPLSTNTLDTFSGTNGTSYFSDPQWTNYPGRFYRFRSP